MRPALPRRLQAELATIRAMTSIYCRAHHGPNRNELCSDCLEILAYAGKRLALCPFQERKPTCGNCPVHCYKPALRERVRRIMRFAGPRMLWHHPLMAIRHMLDCRRPVPALTISQSAIPPSSQDRKRKQA